MVRGGDEENHGRVGGGLGQEADKRPSWNPRSLPGSSVLSTVSLYYPLNLHSRATHLVGNCSDRPFLVLKIQDPITGRRAMSDLRQPSVEGNRPGRSKYGLQILLNLSNRQAVIGLFSATFIGLFSNTGNECHEWDELLMRKFNK
jgi:hypothetical protein